MRSRLTSPARASVVVPPSLAGAILGAVAIVGRWGSIALLPTPLFPFGWSVAVLSWGCAAAPPARLVALRPPSPPPIVGRRIQRLGALGAAAVAVAVLSPMLAVVGVAVLVAVRAGRRRHERRRAADLLLASLPEAVDLLAVGVGAGLTVPLALAAVGRRGQGPVAAGFARAAAQAEMGRRCADALDDVARELGDAVRPLVAALVAADRYGAPLGVSLDRLAGEVRAEQRRRAEEAARRVPVKLLFPLVCCVLPAFALLTVAPMLAGAFQALRP